MPAPPRPDADALASLLAEKLGPGQVLRDADTLRRYGEDLTEVPGHPPDLVVRAHSTADVQAVVRIANEHRVPVVPVVAGLNVGGLAIPEHGGIVLDLAAMNRILEVNEADQYMIVEPGVSWADVRAKLDRDHPALRFGYSFSPPHTSVLCNCLMDGLTNLSLLHGSTGDWINGVEAVLADGSILRTGAHALSPAWCTNSPMPDLTGLFVNFQGSTGIVTRMSVQVWPNRKFRERLFVLAYDIDQAYAFVKRLMREEVCDDIGGVTWPLMKLLFGQARPLYRDPAEPLVALYFDIASNFWQAMTAKKEIFAQLLAEARAAGGRFEDPLDIRDLVRIEPRFVAFADFPTRFDFLLDHPGGGLTWIGSYGPTSQWEAGIKAGMRIMEERGFPPIVVTRPMAGGHFGVLRLITVFDKRDEAEVRRVRALNEALADLVLEKGFVPYKTPGWVVRRHAKALDPGFVRVLGAVRNALDPNRILNPGRWETGG
ncbi:MAG: FAD-binding oxidoreductase [Planctomycetes bacterium]|nr:FAD-binding oxidoreductase [Planctomycetota bacterium]